MRADLTFIAAAMLTASAIAEDIVNPCIASSQLVPAISLGPIVNANIKCWMSPGILSGMIIFFFIFAPLFFIVMCMSCSI